MSTTYSQPIEDFSNILENMSDAFCSVDTAWSLIYVNAHAEKITGRTRDELLGKVFWEAFPELAGTPFYQRHHLKDTTDIDVRTEVFCPTLDLWLEVHALSSPLGLGFFFRDITEQRHSIDNEKRLTEELFFEKAYVDYLLHHMPAGVMICEAPSGRVLYANEPIAKIFGDHLAPANCIEEYARRDGFHPDNRPYQADEWPLARSIATGEVVSGEEVSIKCSDGTPITLLVSSAPIRNKAGEIVAGMVIDHDITDRKKAADELRGLVISEREARLTAEGANHAKDEFIAVLSHELRTPLTPAVMTLAAMESDLRLPKEARDNVKMIRRNVELEMRLIDDLLDVTRITNGKMRMDMRPTNIHTLLKNVLEILRSDLNTKSQKITRMFEARHSGVSGDAARLHQVFWNILKNAIKFTPDAGRISIRTSNPSPDTLAIEIRDSGEGVEAAAMPRIFAAFEQAHHGVLRKFGGLGLGLTISKAIMDLHGGTIRVQSGGKGMGSCFTLEFKTDDAVERPAARITGRLQEDKVSRRTRMLLVDDHQDTLRVLRNLLESLGYQVATASSVSSALMYAATNPIDVLVSDIGLPDASGHDLMRQIKKIQDVPGVAVSGFGLDTDVQSSHKAGFFAHLTKPIQLHILHTTVQQALGHGSQ